MNYRAASCMRRKRNWYLYHAMQVGVKFSIDYFFVVQLLSNQIMSEGSSDQPSVHFYISYTMNGFQLPQPPPLILLNQFLARLLFIYRSYIYKRNLINFICLWILHYISAIYQGLIEYQFGSGYSSHIGLISIQSTLYIFIFIGLT